MRSRTVVALLGIISHTSIAGAQSATRDLPDYYRPGGPPIGISTALADLGGVSAAGVEDKPPTGWTVSNISNGGAYDANSGKVKWGPFFSPSIPTMLTYQVSPSNSSSSEACFTGTVSFDGLDEVIGGESCIPPPVPATSTWGLLLLAVMLIIAGTFIKRRSKVGPHR